MKPLYPMIILLSLCGILLFGCAGDSGTSLDGDDSETPLDGDLEEPMDGDKSDGDDDTEIIVDGDMDDESVDTESESGEAEEEAPDWRAVDLVNPFIATGGEGFGIGSGVPGAAAPFGMVMASPDTMGENGAASFYHEGGYWAEDEYILGFSHTHLYGVGASELGNILFMPTSGEIDEYKTRPKRYRSMFSKENEEAHPGYYSVLLNEYGINAELTADVHSAHHRYLYPSDVENQLLLIDAGASVPGGEISNARITLLNNSHEVEGWAVNDGGFAGRYDGLTVYFVARFNRDFSAHTMWNELELNEEDLQTEGADIGVILTFDSAEGDSLEAQVGISYISIEQARINLDAELSDWDFDGQRIKIEEDWEQELSVVKFEGGTRDQRIIMATALYHAFLMPDSFTDTNGKYLGFDRVVHQAEDFIYYTNFSMWDTYRTQAPLLSLVQPERQRDMMKSLVRMAEEGGNLPQWPQGCGYTGCMVGDPANIIITDAYVKGITDFDVERAYSEMREQSDGPVDHVGRNGVEFYNENGYMAADLHGGSVSQTEEFCVADYAIAELGEALGKPDDEIEVYRDRSHFYRNLWDEETKFLIGKNADGTFVEEFDELLWEDFYTEGNAWQYLWMVPHDMQGLEDLFGSREAMATKLEIFFEEAKVYLDNPSPINALLPPPYYWHGNEPDLHAVYMFLQVGRPDLAQKWIHWISETLYSTEPDGIAGNDDCGTLSSWYVFSAMGFYPITASDIYIVGRPIFKHIEVKTLGGVLTVDAPEASMENIYVQSVTLNGEPLDVPWFKHADIIDGGSLSFEMGPQPGEWGKVSGRTPL